MKRLILTAVVLTLCLPAADAGPLRRLFGRGGRGECQTATAASAQYQPAPVVMSQTGPRHLTSYTREPGTVAGWEPYQPIRVGVPVPACPTCR